MKKRWALLFYLNGNNEIEPEIYNSFKRILKTEEANIDIYIEIGRIQMDFIKRIRALENIIENEDKWVGVRRYVIDEGKVKYIKKLQNINMAHPKQLYDFIDWGIKCSSAEYYSLIIASHGFSFIGGITDFSFDYPYVMPIEEMCNVINKAFYDNNRELDILLLDMCYMNYIEIIYELYKRHSLIKNIITYDGFLELTMKYI